MKRYLQASSAAAALAMIAGSALGAAGDINAIQPVVSNAGDGGAGEYEVTGDGLNGDVSIVVELTGVATDNTGFGGNISLVFYNNAGAQVGLPLVIPAGNISDARGNNDGDIDNNDLLEIDITTALQNAPAGAFSFDVVYADPGGDGDSLTMDNDGFPGLGDDSDDNDTFYRIISDAPEISGGFIQEVAMADDKIFVTINFPSLGIGANSTVRSSLMFPDSGGEPNPNNIGTINQVDFEKDTGSGFEQFENPDDISAVAALMDNDVFFEIDFDETMSDLTVGSEIRVDAASADLRDGTGNLVGGTATLAALPELAVEAATWQTAIGAGAGANAGAIELDFNLDLDLADLGTAAFYNSLEVMGGASGSLSVTAVAAGDANDKVLLTVTQAGGGGADTVTPAGVRPDGESYSLNVDTDMTAGEPSDVFGNAMTVDIASTLADGISPVLDGTITDGVYVDSDGDGVQDGVMLVFGEPLDSALDGADAGDLGVELNRRGGVTLFPFGMVDSVTGVRTSYMTAASADPDDDEITVTSVELMSFDADGDGNIDDLENDNALLFNFDPTQDFEVAGGGWDNDDTTTAGSGDAPGTGDDNAVQIEVDADDSDIADANSVSIDSDPDTDDSDDIDVNSGTDNASPVAVSNSYRTGDNFNGGSFDTFVETDGNVGDDNDNNVFYGVFSEPLTNAGDDPSLISWGAGAMDRFQAGDVTRILGADNTILQIEDTNARGFEAGDTLTFAEGNDIDDAAGNDILGMIEAPDGTPPFVADQTDINGNDVTSAFLFDTSDPADGFADEVRLFTGAPVDPATVLLGDFAFNGGTDFDSIAINASGQQITLTFPSGSNLPLSNNVTVTYTAPANNDDMDSQIIAGPGGNSVFPGLTTTITARQFPLADVDTDDLAVMDLRGDITMGGNPIGVGAKVYGFVAVPVPAMISGQIRGIDFWTSDSSDLEAFFDFIYGFESHLYFIDDDGDLWFTNDYEDNSGNTYAIYDISVNAANLENISFTGRGRSYTAGDSVPQTGLTVTGGRVTMKWDLLRSNNGTIDGLKSSGYEVDGDAIASRAVVSDADGSYAMHVSAPITQFYSTFGTAGWPVILVVEEATGTRYPATSVLNATDNEGTLFFRPLQRNTDPNDNNARGSGSNVVFDINLDNVGMEYMYQGWGLLPFNRVSGFAMSTGNIPTLPAIQGSDNSNVVVNSSLPYDRAFNQFCFFEDNNSDGEWTSADDADFFDSLFVDVNCFENMRFVMTNRGVSVGNSINGFVGGYAAGFWNGHFQNIGVFQFGAAGSASEVFTGTFSSSTTLGWALVTAPADDADPAAFLNTNDADFMIEFNRISGAEVDVNTYGNETDNINNVVEINAGQGYFISFE